MKLLVEGAPLRGTVEIPGSKSHSIRAVAIAARGGAMVLARRYVCDLTEKVEMPDAKAA